jgi:N-acyl-D-amino-acid deacylase
VASFVGAATVRRHVLGEDDVAPTPAQLARMRDLVEEAMREGAVGLGSALIYVPGCFASTEELVTLAEVVGAHGGMYISHLRSEGDRFLEAVDELLTIARRAGCAAEIFHLKAAGKANWGKLEDVIRKVEGARAEGLPITADMYTYAASSTGLDATMPPWVRERGHRAWVERLRDPALRARLGREMTTPTEAWENRFLNVGPENVLLVSFRNPALRPLIGKTLAEAATLRGTTPAEAAMDLVVEDDSRVGAVYFAMSEDNVRRQIRLPWVSFCSDSPPMAAEGEFLADGVHPRAYGTFARLLGRYVREERLIPLEEAVRRLAALPAASLKLDRRGTLRPGSFADVIVFDPATVADHATFERPHQYATGVRHVLVNGTAVLRDGEHTGAKPGRVVHGPGRRG